MPVTPRRKSNGDPEAIARLTQYARARNQAIDGLRQAVRDASDSGASIRVIAEHSGLSTRTVQDWLKQD